MQVFIKISERRFGQTMCHKSFIQQRKNIVFQIAWKSISLFLLIFYIKFKNLLNAIFMRECLFGIYDSVNVSS